MTKTTKCQWKPIKVDSTHRQIILDEAKDDVSTNKNSCTSYASAAVHSDRPFMVHRPQVADEANQLLGGVRHAVVRPVCELQVSNKMCFGSLEWQFIKNLHKTCIYSFFTVSQKRKCPSLTSLSTIRMILMWKYSRYCWFSRWSWYLPTSKGTPSFSGQYLWHLILPRSTSWVIMETTLDLFSQIICQKVCTVEGKGPWQEM